MNLSKLNSVKLEITTDTSDNLKGVCLSCDIENWLTDDYIDTIRAKDFKELEEKLDKYLK